MLYILILWAIVCPQKYCEGFDTWADIKPYIGSKWELTGSDFLFTLDKPEWPEVADEVKYHATAVIYQGDRIQIIDHECKRYAMWWRVRVIRGQFEHSSGWFAHGWIKKWCTKVK